MLSFTKNFTPQEKYRFWNPYEKPPTTVCRMTFSLKNGNEEIFQINTNSCTSEDHTHAEVIAYGRLKNLSKLLSEHKTDSSVLDFIIASNNSPCSDCRELIFGWVDDLIKEITSVRLILFFSNLYKTDLSDGSSIIRLFTDWILKLVRIGTVVIICPIVVFKMLPEFDYRFKELLNVVKSDEKIIKKFRKLLKKLESRITPQNNFFSISPSHDFFNKDDSVFLSLFTWENPQNISIVPRDKEHLGEFILKFPLTEVAERISPKSKKTSEIQKFRNIQKYYPRSYLYNRNPLGRKSYLRGKQQNVFAKHISRNKLKKLRMSLI